MSGRVQELLQEVMNGRGCKVGQITDSDAVLFIEGVCRMYRAGQKPQIAKASKILQNEWNINIDRRRLSDHIRGECGCQKK